MNEIVHHSGQNRCAFALAVSVCVGDKPVAKRAKDAAIAVVTALMVGFCSVGCGWSSGKKLSFGTCTKLLEREIRKHAGLPQPEHKWHTRPSWVAGEVKTSSDPLELFPHLVNTFLK